MVSFEGFRAVDGVPIYLQIQTYIRRGCVAGTIRDGDELPSRRVLSALLGVNPNTVQKAFRLLEDEGLDRVAFRREELCDRGRREARRTAADAAARGAAGRDALAAADGHCAGRTRCASFRNFGRKRHAKTPERLCALHPGKALEAAAHAGRGGWNFYCGVLHSGPRAGLGQRRRAGHPRAAHPLRAELHRRDDHLLQPGYEAREDVLFSAKAANFGARVPALGRAGRPRSASCCSTARRS